ncbi:MAG TPA: response regulator [Chryseosolibacter sp.]|nr:response regulator [Chryseosolibacter sp.]
MVDRKTTSLSQHQGKSCLLIDDDDDDKEIFCIALGEANPAVKCFTADNGLEALQMLRDGSLVPDYIFLDLNMPLMSGKECLVEIRKQNHLKNTPVIIYSTSASERDIQETSILGASGFITKPPLLGALIEKLVEVFEGQPANKRS